MKCWICSIKDDDDDDDGVCSSSLLLLLLLECLVGAGGTITWGGGVRIGNGYCGGIEEGSYSSSVPIEEVDDFDVEDGKVEEEVGVVYVEK